MHGVSSTPTEHPSAPTTPDFLCLLTLHPHPFFWVSSYHGLFPGLTSASFQVAGAGQLGPKGMAITFVPDENDAKILTDVQDRFEVSSSELTMRCTSPTASLDLRKLASPTLQSACSLVYAIECLKWVPSA